MTVGESRTRERTGATVVGAWFQGDGDAAVVIGPDDGIATFSSLTGGGTGSDSGGGS